MPEGEVKEGTESFVLYARHISEWRITPIGVVVYDSVTGEKLGQRFDTLDEAIRRGDLGKWAKDFDFETFMQQVPADLKSMIRVLESTSNAMSALRWSSCSISIVNAIKAAGSAAQYVDAQFYSVVRPDLEPLKGEGVSGSGKGSAEGDAKAG